jgi:hypothetical protein
MRPSPLLVAGEAALKSALETLKNVGDVQVSFQIFDASSAADLFGTYVITFVSNTGSLPL